MAFDVERAAALLIGARRTGKLIEPFHPGPRDREEAYAVQDEVARIFGPPAGWKVGARAPGETPSAAPLLAGLVRPSPTDWPSSSLHMIGIEAEIAFRIDRDVGPRSEPLARDEIWEAVESVHAAVEIVDTRLSNWKDADPLWALADNQSNGGLVYDPDGIPFQDRSFADAPVRLTVDGRVLVEHRGGNSAGDPRWLLEWLVNHCVRSRGGMRAGTIVTTGSYTGMPFVERGASVEATFEGIGAVAVRFTEA